MSTWSAFFPGQYPVISWMIWEHLRRPLRICLRRKMLPLFFGTLIDFTVLSLAYKNISYCFWLNSCCRKWLLWLTVQEESLTHPQAPEVPQPVPQAVPLVDPGYGWACCRWMHNTHGCILGNGFEFWGLGAHLNTYQIWTKYQQWTLFG